MYQIQKKCGGISIVLGVERTCDLEEPNNFWHWLSCIRKTMDFRRLSVGYPQKVWTDKLSVLIVLGRRKSRVTFGSDVVHNPNPGYGIMRIIRDYIVLLCHYLRYVLCRVPFWVLMNCTAARIQILTSCLACSGAAAICPAPASCDLNSHPELSGWRSPCMSLMQIFVFHSSIMCAN